MIKLREKVSKSMWPEMLPFWDTMFKWNYDILADGYGFDKISS